MQVDSRVAAGDAKRGVSRLGNLPFLAIPHADLNITATILWSGENRKRDTMRERLRDDDDRVQNVVAGIGPSMTERIQQARTERADTHARAERQAFAKDLANEHANLRKGSSGQANEQFANNEPKSEPILDDSQTPSSKPGFAASGSGMANAETESIDSLANAPNATTGPKVVPSEAEPHQADQSRRIPQQTPMPAANNPALSMQLRGAAVSPAQPNSQNLVQTAADSGNSQSQSVAPVGAESSAQAKDTAPAPVESANTDRNPTARTSRQASATPEEQTHADEADGDRRAENVQRMLRVLRGSLMRDKSSTVIRLDPPELGSLRLEMNLRKDAMHLRVGAETDAAREMLKDELETLRNGLQAAGIRLDRVEVYSLAAPPPLEPSDPRTLERQTNGESRDSSSRRSTAREAATRVDAPDPEWMPECLQSASVGPGCVNVVI